MNGSRVNDDTLVESLVADALEMRARGESEDAIDALADGDESLRERVRDALGVSERMLELHHRSFGTPRVTGAVIADRYELGEPLGRGAMGAVFDARDTTLERSVAIKLIVGPLMGAEVAADRILREAGALAAIRHEAVVTIHDRGTLPDGQPFLVMERIDGAPLSELLDDETDVAEFIDTDALDHESDVRVATRWIADVAAGVSAAHRAGVTHRDIKPSNVMIRRDGRAVILDFGIAAVEGHERLTHEESALGTPAYMAPEALAGRPDAPAALDVYGLAATLYHLLVRRAPYTGSPAEVLAALATREPVSLGALRPDLPADLRGIVEHGMERRPADRYPSVEAFEKDLRAFLAHEPVSVRPLSRAARAVRSVRRSRVARGAAAMLAVVLLVALVSGAAFLHEERRAAEGRDAQAALVANLGVTAPAQRRPPAEADRDAILRSLDRYVDAAVEPVPALTLRAAFRFDVGDRDGAADDMERVAQVVGSAYSESLARVYRDAANGPEDIDATSLALDSLPAPEEPFDHYLAGYHELRQMRRAEAAAHLDRPSLANVRHARELVVLCSSLEIDRWRKPEDQRKRYEAAGAMLAGAHAVEEEFGGPSAMTRHLASAALGAQRRWVESLDAAHESLELCEHSLVAHRNAANSARYLRRTELVREHVAAGLRLAPGYAALVDQLVRAEASAGRHDEARRVLESHELSPRHAGLLRSLVATDEAVHAGDSTRQIELAERALEVVRAADSDGRSSTMRDLAMLAEALVEGDRGKRFHALLRQHVRMPLSASVLADLLDSFPESVPVEAMPELRHLLQSVYDAVTTGTTVAAPRSH